MTPRQHSARTSWPRPTLRGWVFLAAGGLAFLIGLLLERRDVLFIGCFLIAALIVAAGYVLLRRLRLKVTRTFSPHIVAAGSESVVALVVQNLSARPSYGARWHDSAERGIQSPDSALLPSLGRHGRPDEQDTARLEYTVTPRRRGVYGIGPLVVQCSDPFGLATSELTTGPEHDLVVTPRVTPLPGNALSLTSGEGSMHELLRLTNPNADELIAREYRQGDSLRRMNWPATARHGELMVRQEEQRSNPEARLVLDTSLSGSARPVRAERMRRLEPAFELALEMAASIGIHLLEAGYLLDVIETGPSQLSAGGDRLRGDAATAFRLPAGDRDFLEGLANLVLPDLAAPRDGDARSVTVGQHAVGRIPTFAVLIDLDDHEVRELGALRAFAEPAVAFVLETMRHERIEWLIDHGWQCVPLRGARSIAQAWSITDRMRVRDVV